MNRFLHLLTVLGLVSFLTMGAAGVVGGDDDDVLRLRFDVAQDGSTFVVLGPTDGGFSLQGASFSVLGYVYPKGTLQGGAVSGTNADGSPSFPDKVIGTWSCRGWFTKPDAVDVTGAVLVGTQLWDFNLDKPGSRTIVTDGIDLSVNDEDFGVPFKRAIAGGTGRKFKGASGEQIEINFGFNESLGIDSTHILKIQRNDD